jgi:signal transduction histidine kinase
LELFLHILRFKGSVVSIEYLFPIMYLSAAVVFSLLLITSAARLRYGKRLRGATRGLLPLFGVLGALGFGAEAARGWNWLPGIQEAFLARLPSYALFLLALVVLYLTQVHRANPTHNRITLAGALGWIAWVITLDANLLRLPEVITLAPTLALVRQGAAHVLLSAGFGGLSLLSAVSLVNGLREGDLHHERNPLHYLSLALILLSGGGVLLLAGRPVGLLFYLLGSLMVAYVFLAFRLPDFRRSLARILSFGLVSGLAFIFYVAGYVLIQGFFHAWPGDQPLLPGIVLAVLLIALFNPALQWIQARLEDMMPVRDRDAAQVLRQYSQNITNVLDLQLLAAVVVGAASEALDIRRGFLFLVDYEKDASGSSRFLLRGVKGLGTSKNPPTRHLAGDSPLAEYLRRQHYPLTLSEIEDEPRFQDLPASEKEWLYALGIEVLAPVFAKDEWIGLLALGPRSGGEPFQAESCDLVAVLADQTAVAMENVRLVEGLMRLNNDFRRAFAAMEQAHHHLERLDRTKSDFISIASHELRTPLTVISGSTQMLMEAPELQDNFYYKQLLEKITNGTVRLREIVDSLLDMAKIDSRALELAAQPVDIKTVIYSLGNELRSTFDERKQEFVVEALDSLPAIEADQEALRKVFYHLLVNAIKYTPDGGQVSVCGGGIPAGDDERLGQEGIEIVIGDTGIGIDPRQQELIFGKFYQTGELVLHSSGKTKFKGGGPGLGLAIARGVVDAHGGYVWVESPGYDEEKCPGSRFFVRLPLRQSGQQRFPARSDMLFYSQR